MHAFEIPGTRFSLPASATIERYRFVTVNSNSKAALPSANAAVIGASMNKATVDQVSEIADGIVMIEASAAIAAGASVATTAEGKAVTYTTGEVVGIALTAASAAGELVACKI